MVGTILRFKTLEERARESKRLCEQALREPSLRAAEDLVARSNASAIALLDQTLELREPSAALLELAKQSDSLGIAKARALERALLARAGLSLLDEISDLPVEDSVRHLVCKEIAFMATPSEETLPHFEVTGDRFMTMSKIVRARRFPAGQHQWEISGFPRRWLAKLSPLLLIKTTAFLFGKAGGLYPYIESHLAPVFRGVPMLLEREFWMAFYRMARSLERQPEIKALMASSWLHSPETHRVSPHLEFMNRPFEQAGGLIIEIGRSRPDDGFLKGDQKRAELYCAGQYRPTCGVALCSREQALAWADAHPEIGELAMRIP